MQDSESWREKVARIIDPVGWADRDESLAALRFPLLTVTGRAGWEYRAESSVKSSLAKADAIAALSPSPHPDGVSVSGDAMQNVSVEPSRSPPQGESTAVGGPMAALLRRAIGDLLIIADGEVDSAHAATYAKDMAAEIEEELASLPPPPAAGQDLSEASGDGSSPQNITEPD